MSSCEERADGEMMPGVSGAELPGRPGLAREGRGPCRTRMQVRKAQGIQRCEEVLLFLGLKGNLGGKGSQS